SVILLSMATVTLQPNWPLIYRGETITVRCEIQGGGRTEWTYEWKADKLDRRPTHNEHRITAATESDSGRYSCRGRNDYLLTEWSEVVTLTVSVPNRAVVTLQPSWSQLFRGETVTLRCEIMDGANTEWEYEWKTTNSLKPPTQHDYKIQPVLSSANGEYSCKGRSKGSQSLTKWKNLFPPDQPKPVLTVSPSWLSPGASVTLNCEVEHPSAGWRFYWYKATHTAGYVCRAGRGDPVFYIQYSELKLVWSPNWPLIYRGETITVRCEIQGGERTEWTYEWKADKLDRRPTHNEYRITAATESDSGKYSCRGRNDYLLTEWSEVVTLTVSGEMSVATVNHLPPFNPILCILLTHTNYPHVLLHYIQEPPLPMFTVPPLNMSKPSQSGFSGFFSKTSNMSCPSDVLIPDPIHPHHSQREPQHLQLCYLQLCLLSFSQCHCL
uniref:Ig-like domain-containing protein n=1 Tax=Mastacembelus armatus TaxID=205130 RepID=A0A3Q3M0F5_9TELE